MCFFSFLVESKISLSKLWAEARVGNEFWSCPCCLGKLIGFVRLSYLGKELWTLVHQIVDSIHELWDETCMLIGYHMGDHYLTTLSSKKSSTRISVPHHIQKNEKKTKQKTVGNWESWWTVLKTSWWPIFFFPPTSSLKCDRNLTLRFSKAILNHTKRWLILVSK